MSLRDPPQKAPCFRAFPFQSDTTGIGIGARNAGSLPSPAAHLYGSAGLTLSELCLADGAARKVRRESRCATNFNSWSAPIVDSRSTQASIVRAFFMTISKTCVRLSVIPSPRSDPGDGR